MSEVEEFHAANDPQAAQSIGERLRAAREARGLSLPEMADRTKVNQRMLSAIERHALDEMPVGPYAAGFTRAYARELGMDEHAAADEMRRAMEARNQVGLRPAPIYEPADANRVPSGRFALNAALAGAALLAAYLGYQWWSNRPPAPAEVTDASSRPSNGIAAATSAATATTMTATQPVDPAATARFSGPLRIASTGRAWISLEDANGRGQFDLTLARGEYYTVRENQRGLKLRTDNASALRLVVGEQRLSLGEGNAVSGVRLDAASLAQRAAAGGVAPASVQPDAATLPTAGPVVGVAPEAAPGGRRAPDSAF